MGLRASKAAAGPRDREDLGSACGKAILVGEHFVLHGSPAVAVPLPGCRLRLIPGTSDRPKSVVAAWQRAWEVLGGSAPMPLPFRVASEIPRGAGLGSSAALSVALVRLAASRMERPLSPLDLARAARRVEDLFHRPSSGLDPALVAFETPLLWRTDAPPEVLPWSLPDLEIVVALAPGTRSTANAVDRVQAFARRHPKEFQEYVETSRHLAEAWAAGLRLGHPPGGETLRQAHGMLRQMGLSSPRIEEMVLAMEAAGAVAAKISGAGLAGAVLALCPVPRLPSVQEAAIRAGGVRVLRAGLATGSLPG